MGAAGAAAGQRMHVLLESIMLILKGNFGAELIMLIKSSAAAPGWAGLGWAALLK